MRIVLRLLAAIIVVTTDAWWFQAGQNPGWTKNKVAVEKVDEITGIVYSEYEDRFVPGVDLLAAAGISALVLGGLSCMGRRNNKGRMQH